MSCSFAIVTIALCANLGTSVRTDRYDDLQQDGNMMSTDFIGYECDEDEWWDFLRKFDLILENGSYDFPRAYSNHPICNSRNVLWLWPDPVSDWNNAFSNSHRLCFRLLNWHYGHACSVQVTRVASVYAAEAILDQYEDNSIMHAVLGGHGTANSLHWGECEEPVSGTECLVIDDQLLIFENFSRGYLRRNLTHFARGESLLAAGSPVRVDLSDTPGEYRILAPSTATLNKGEGVEIATLDKGSAVEVLEVIDMRPDLPQIRGRIKGGYIFPLRHTKTYARWAIKLWDPLSDREDTYNMLPILPSGVVEYEGVKCCDGTDLDLTEISTPFLTKLHRKMHSHGSLVLDSCNSAAPNGGDLNLAQHVANAVRKGIRVFAIDEEHRTTDVQKFHPYHAHLNLKDPIIHVVGAKCPSWAAQGSLSEEDNCECPPDQTCLFNCRATAGRPIYESSKSAEVIGYMSPGQSIFLAGPLIWEERVTEADSQPTQHRMVPVEPSGAVEFLFLECDSCPDARGSTSDKRFLPSCAEEWAKLKCRCA